MSFARLALISRLVLAATAASYLACATISGEQGEPNYAADAETNLKLGNEDFAHGNYAEAQQYFEYVRAKYPFLEAAKEAELRAADSMFEREQYLEARDAYQNFVKLHPTYPKVDYAAFKAALTHFKQMPSNFFLLPPPEEKDQTEVVDALHSMNDFVRQFPKSQYLPDAQQVIQSTRQQLAKHEMYVAGFYRKRDRWQGVANRYETVVKDYPGLGFDEEALFGMHEAYLKLNQPEKAKAALEELIKRMPGTPAADKAKRLLAQS